VLFGDVVHLTLDDPTTDWPRARAALEAAGVVITDDAPGEPSLEDVFIDIVANGGRDGD
jgi:hypothetical protein